MSIFSIFIILFGLFSFTSSKVVQGALPINLFRNESWTTLTQFITSPGTSQYLIKVWNEPYRENNSTGNQIELTLRVYQLEDWKQVRSHQCSSSGPQANRSISFNVPLNGSEIKIPSQSLNSGTEYGIWMFTLDECKGDYFKERLNGNKLQFRLEVLNSDGSQFSEEENGILSVILIAFIPLSCLLLFQSFQVASFYFKQTAIDYPVLILTFALFLEFFALLGEFLHLYVYSKDGEGLFLLDWSNIALTHLSQFVISGLFVLMSNGWTVKPLQKKDKEIFLGFGVVTGVMVVAMSISAKETNNEFEIFHDYEIWSGKILILLKLLMYYLFIVQLMPNYKESDTPKLKGHYQRLGIFGSFYLLSLPFAVLFAVFILPIHQRHKAITTVSILVQTMALLGYVLVLSKKDNECYPIHYKNNKFVSVAKMI